MRNHSDKSATRNLQSGMNTGIRRGNWGHIIFPRIARATYYFQGCRRVANYSRARVKQGRVLFI